MVTSWARILRLVEGVTYPPWKEVNSLRGNRLFVISDVFSYQQENIVKKEE
jgi:hypothetical protein